MNILAIRSKLCFIVAVSLALLSSAANAITVAPTVSWIDWTTTSAGTLSNGGPAFNVSLSGPARSLVNGDYYYNNTNTGGTSATGTYAGLAPTDLIQTSTTGAFTFTFAQAVTNPYLAIVSQGQASRPVTYDFGQTLYNVISFGSNYWGYTGYDATNPNKFKGYEYNGVLQLLGTFNAITFNVENPENWHGFNIGVSAVPLPAALPLMLSGLGVLGFAARRRKAALA